MILRNRTPASGCLKRITQWKQSPNRNITRHFSSPNYRPTTRSPATRHTLLAPRLPCPATTALPRFRPNWSTLRFASTVPSPLPPTNVETVATPTDQIVPSKLEDFLSSDWTAPTVVDEHIGYLKELGLDYGWGPTAFIETLLEYVYIYSGLPWCGAIVLTAVMVRAAMLKFYVIAADAAGRMAVLQPHLEPIKERMKEARLAGDMAAAQVEAAQLKQMTQAAGLKISHLFLPVLQVPLAFGTFRLMRGMAELPVPGLDSGGFLWVKDLTVSDPYFVLPILGSVAIWYTFKKGTELGTSTVTQSPGLRAAFLYIFPTMSFLFGMLWPACFQLTFVTTSFLALGQTTMLRTPRVRSFLGIQPLPQSPQNASQNKGIESGPYTGTINFYKAPSVTPPPPVEEKKGFISGAISDIKGASSTVVKSARAMQSKWLKEREQKQGATSKRSASQVREAQAYEARRRKEIEQLKSQRRRQR